MYTTPLHAKLPSTHRRVAHLTTYQRTRVWLKFARKKSSHTFNFQETASATLALTCGKNDRGHNETIHLQVFLAIVYALLAKDIHDDGLRGDRY